MALLEEVLQANQAYLAGPHADYQNEIHTIGKKPSRKIAILTCMDARLVDFLGPALGIHRGEANVIKVAGNYVSGPFSDAVRSLLVSIYELDVTEIFVIGHHECGMEKTTATDLKEKMLARGISEDAIAMVFPRMVSWADYFGLSHENVAEAVTKLRQNPLIPKDVYIHGLMFDPYSGKVDLVVNGYEAGKR